MPNTITGFLPYRSATNPQRTEVKDLPSINEAPYIKQKKRKHGVSNADIILRDYLTCNKRHVNVTQIQLTYKTCIKSNIFLSFCNVEVSYLH